jgi:hypothetical protein
MGSFPFTSYKQVFVEDAYSPCQTGATISIFSSSVLVDKDIIEQTYETRRVLTKALTSQYIDHYLGKKSWYIRLAILRVIKLVINMIELN